MRRRTDLQHDESVHLFRYSERNRSDRRASKPRARASLQRPRRTISTVNTLLKIMQGATDAVFSRDEYLFL